MGQRAYEVVFEEYQSSQWVSNAFKRVVFIKGGAEQAIKVALEREKETREPESRIRAESVTLIVEEY